MADSRQIEARAADWLARRDADDWTAQEQQALDAWLAESARHKVAFLRLQSAWTEAGRLQALGAGVPAGMLPPRRTPPADADATHPDARPDLRDITDRLYGGDTEHRLRQEILLGVGGVRALDALGVDAQVFHTNEGHAGFLGLERIRQLGARPGVSVNPATPLGTLSEILPYVDLVLVMSVNPGFGGQQYVPTSTAKIAALRAQLEERHLWSVELEVDGGISPQNAGVIAEAGASVLVAGAAVFNDDASVAENLAALRRAAAASPARDHAG